MLKKTLVLIGLTLSFNTSALVISTDDTRFGPDTITRDAATGLDWLDVTITRGLSYDQVFAEVGVGGAYEGFRYATTEELDRLITNFGYIPINQNCTYSLKNCDAELQSDNPVVELMIFTLGDTLDAYYDELNVNIDFGPNGAGFTYGMLADTPMTTGPALIGLGEIYDDEHIDRDTGRPGGDSHDWVVSAFGFTDKSDTGRFFGSFLVKATPIPLPSSLLLFVSSLLSLGVIKLRKT